MARGLLLVGAILWLLAGVVGLIIAAFFTPALERLLPPLVIDTDALRGAVLAVGTGLVGMGLVHVVVLIGLGAGRRWGSTGGILLAGVLSAALLALAASAATSAVATPASAPMLVGAAVVAAGAAAGYVLAASRLVSARRSRPTV